MCGYVFLADTCFRNTPLGAVSKMTWRALGMETFLLSHKHFLSSQVFIFQFGGSYHTQLSVSGC